MGRLHNEEFKHEAVRMGWQHLYNDLIGVAQRKTNAKLKIPIHPKLAAAIGNMPRKNVTFLPKEAGAPFSAAGFGNWFHERFNEAGLQHRSAHGLRKACASLLANAGCTESKSKQSRGIKC